MCRAGGRRCNGPSCGAAGARQRQAKRRARLALEAAYAGDDLEAIGKAKIKYENVTGEQAPKPAPKTPAPGTDLEARKAAAAKLPATGTTEERIQAAVYTLADRSGGAVGLMDLRAALGDIDHDELSRTLQSMSRNGNANIFPESNRKQLTQQDKDASVRIGGEANHLISIQEHQRPQAAVESKIPAPTAAPKPEKPVTQSGKPNPAVPKTDPTKTGTTEERIRAAFKAQAKQQGDWIRISRIREAVGGDVTHDEITQVLTEMARRSDGVHLAPESNRKVLTEADHHSAVKLGGEDKHIVAIEPPCIPGAADHVRAIGTANATDEELENGLNAPEARSALYDEIRAEQRRRKQT